MISVSIVVEEGCFFGVNSTIRDNIKIAENCVIGAGAIKTKNTIKDGIYYGPQANILKKNVPVNKFASEHINIFSKK